MKSTLQYRKPQRIESPYAYGESAEATDLESALEQICERFSASETMNADVYRELGRTYVECSEENWDGYDAHPVSSESFRRATELLRQFVGRVASPQVGATPRGSLYFEWLVAPDRRFSVIVGEEDELAYAGLFGTASVHGTEPFFGHFPQVLWDQVERLYPQ